MINSSNLNPLAATADINFFYFFLVILTQGPIMQLFLTNGT